MAWVPNTFQQLPRSRPCADIGRTLGARLKLMGSVQGGGSVFPERRSAQLRNALRPPHPQDLENLTSLGKLLTWNQLGARSGGLPRLSKCPSPQPAGNPCLCHPSTHRGTPQPGRNFRTKPRCTFSGAPLSLHGACRACSLFQLTGDQTLLSVENFPGQGAAVHTPDNQK